MLCCYSWLCCLLALFGLSDAFRLPQAHERLAARTSPREHESTRGLRLKVRRDSTLIRPTLIRRWFGVDSALIRRWFDVDSALIRRWFGIDSALIRHWFVIRSFGVDSALIRRWFDIFCVDSLIWRCNALIQLHWFLHSVWILYRINAKSMSTSKVAKSMPNQCQINVEMPNQCQINATPNQCQINAKSMPNHLNVWIRTAPAATQTPKLKSTHSVSLVLHLQWISSLHSTRSLGRTAS